jgi:hypothetical protein
MLIPPPFRRHVEIGRLDLGPIFPAPYHGAEGRMGGPRPCDLIALDSNFKPGGVRILCRRLKLGRIHQITLNSI